MSNTFKTCRHCEAVISESRRFCDAHFQLELQIYEKDMVKYKEEYQIYLDELAAWEALPQKDKDDIAAANVAKQKEEFLRNSELEDDGFRRVMSTIGGSLWLALKLSSAWFIVNMLAALAGFYDAFSAGMYIGFGLFVIVPASVCIVAWREFTGRNKKYTSFHPYKDDGRPPKPIEPSIPAP